MTGAPFACHAYRESVENGHPTGVCICGKAGEHK